MDSFLILIDAGYVYAAAGALIHGTPARRELLLNHGALRDHLASFGREQTGVSLLRLYWYDAAPNRMPTREHEHIASLRSVQLRLGRLSNAGLQKGVDSLIYRDLFTLARSGRVSDVFLVAGDEDLLEGVHAAKDLGVRVHLIGIEPSQGNPVGGAASGGRRDVRPATRGPGDGHASQDGRCAVAPTASVVAVRCRCRCARPRRGRSQKRRARTSFGMPHTGFARDYWTQAGADDRAYLEGELRSTATNRRLPQRTDGWMLRLATEGLGRRLTESEKWHGRAEFLGGK